MSLEHSRPLGVIASAVVLSALVANVHAEESRTLPEGTPVRMKINRTVSSSSVQQGENIDFRTLDDVKIDDAVVIPKGSTAIATVTEAVPKGHMGKGGKLNMNIDYVQLPSGEQLPLRGIQAVRGGGHTGAMTGGMVATAIVFWPAAPLFLFMHGKDISIREGHEITVYTNSEYNLLAATTKVVTTAKTPVGSSLHNSDVIKLNNAGFSEQLIVAKIKSSPASYDLATDDLMKLRAEGLSDDVIAAMLAVSAR